MSNSETWKQKIIRHVASLALTFVSAAVAVFALTAEAAMLAGASLNGAMLSAAASAGVIAGVREVLKVLKEIKPV